MKSRLAQVLFDHGGKTGIIFDQQDAFVHALSTVPARPRT
jgi:hypothetical protein